MPASLKSSIIRNILGRRAQFDGQQQAAAPDFHDLRMIRQQRFVEDASAFDVFHRAGFQQIFEAASPVAQQTGCPPKVVMCPR